MGGGSSRTWAFAHRVCIVQATLLTACVRAWQELDRIINLTDAFDDDFTEVGIRLATSDIDPLTVVHGETLPDQIAALATAYWQGLPLAPLDTSAAFRTQAKEGTGATSTLIPMRSLDT